MDTSLTPAYNAEKVPKKTIKLVIRQTYPDWNFVVVNDGSTDNTKAIYRKYSRKDSRITYYSQSNKGLIEPRKVLHGNIGEGTLHLLVLMIYAQMLEIFVKTAQETKEDIVMMEDIQTCLGVFGMALIPKSIKLRILKPDCVLEKMCCRFISCIRNIM